MKYRCDGTKECKDNSDEEGYEGKSYFVFRYFVNEICKLLKFKAEGLEFATIAIIWIL
jgi:hypothetical protein